MTKGGSCFSLLTRGVWKNIVDLVEGVMEGGKLGCIQILDHIDFAVLDAAEGAGYAVTVLQGNADRTADKVHRFLLQLHAALHLTGLIRGGTWIESLLWQYTIRKLLYAYVPAACSNTVDAHGVIQKKINTFMFIYEEITSEFGYTTY